MSLTDEQAVRLMNAWRRLTAFAALIDRPGVSPQVIELVREFVEPALADLGKVADELPPEQVSATHRATSAWFPNLREPRWHRFKTDR